MDPDLLPYTCRGCLTIETKAVLHSFHNELVRTLYSECTAIKISLDDTFLPQQICSLCFGRCENWDNFRNRCQVNEAELQSKIAESSSDPIKPENIWYDNDEQVSESVSILELECDPNTVQDEVSCESSVIINESSEVVSDNAGSSSQGPGEVDTPTIICDECGVSIRGMLRFKKHMFYHEKKMTKRIRCVSKVIVEAKADETVLLKSWTQRARQKLRNSGQEYINSNAKLVEKKQMKEVPCKCLHKCNENFTEEDRRRIFDMYWGLDYGSQRLFINENVLERSCTRRVAIYDSRRQYTLEYSFEGKRVCKKFFIGTLDVSDRIVMVCKAKARQNIDVTKDFRGSHGVPRRKKLGNRV